MIIVSLTNFWGNKAKILKILLSVIFWACPILYYPVFTFLLITKVVVAAYTNIDGKGISL